MPDKHPTELLQESDKEIHDLELFIEDLHTQILLKKMKLEKAKFKKQSLLNYLNENE